MTDLLGTPSLDTTSRVRNEKARKYLISMRKKESVSFSQKLPHADPFAVKLLERFLVFGLKGRPNEEEVLSITLDDWSDEEIESMNKVGGKFSVNSIYEASMPDGISKPGADSSHERCSKFIRQN
ncbi:hypothetical protein MKX03_034402 [Papaver bracteatum]|nr:hypothetical protein MKX03_034402 [Papaver bracteatum]